MPTRHDGLCLKGVHDLRVPGSQYNDGRCKECTRAYQTNRHHRLNPDAEYRGRRRQKAKKHLEQIEAVQQEDKNQAEV